MRDLILFIGCDSVAQIKNGEFYILKNYNDLGVTKTSLKGFKQYLKKLNNVCNTTWNEKLRANYKEICNEVGMK